MISNLYLKNTHCSQAENQLRQVLFVSFGICVFVSWLVLFLSASTMASFYRVERAEIPLIKMPSIRSTSEKKESFEQKIISKNAYNSSLIIGIKVTKNGQHLAIIDSGESFRLPSEENKFQLALIKRAQRLVHFHLSQMTHPKEVGHVQVWIDKETKPQIYNAILRNLAQAGYQKIFLPFFPEKELKVQYEP